MQVLWAGEAPMTARQVAEALSDRDLAYTTILTVLTRLEQKGVLQRTPAGRAHAYAPRGSRAEHTAVLMQQALGQADDREAALQRFARSVSPDEAEALRRALADMDDTALPDSPA